MKNNKNPTHKMMTETRTLLTRWKNAKEMHIDL